MGRRCKRMKSVAFGGANSKNESADNLSGSVGHSVESGEPEPSGKFQVDCSQFDAASFASRCSVHLIHEVVSGFDSQKREIVKSVGFEGILHFPAIKQFNRRFALWLMRCVNTESSSLHIGQHICVRFNKFDVGHVFGIPVVGKRILDPMMPCREAKELVLRNFLEQRFKEQRSVKIVQEIIQRSYPDPMSKADRDIFKVAFVVFVISNLLCPSSKHDYASLDYWNAIQDPDSIHTYDWSDYVIVRLLEAVSKLKHDVASNIKFPNITGCVIFLQVFYLDSLDLDDFVMVHNSFPRVRDFSYEKMRAMISADSNFYLEISGGEDRLPAKLRNPVDCVYSWAMQFHSHSSQSRDGSMLAIWETAVAMVHLLDIPFEAAGPVFVAAADFQQQVNSGLDVSGTQALKFMAVLVSIMLPYRRGLSYQRSQLYDLATPGYGEIESAISNGINLMALPIRSSSKKLCNVVLQQSQNAVSAVDESSLSSSSKCVDESQSISSKLI